VTNGTSNGPEVFPAENGWIEGSVTWNTKPARTGGAVFDAAAMATNGWYEFDVTPMITGNGTFTINLASVSTDAVRFHSREGANPPELVVEADATPDTTPPTVTATSPTSGAGDVAVSAAVTVTFSEPMNPTSIHGASFMLSDGGGVAGVVSYDDPSMTATFSPSGPLAFDTIHTATLTTAVTDVAGNPLAAPYVWSFTTEATDTDPPETSIESGPPAETGDSSAAFAFTADEPGSTFQCSLDGAAFAPCSSPASYNGLAVGAHHFEVRATDQAGNTDPTPASWDWTVTASSTFLAVADTHVNSSRTTTNFGDATTIISDGGPHVVEALLRFDVSGVGGSVESAVLRIYVTNGSWNGPVVFPAENGWDETSVNWNTKPARTGGAVADAGGIAAGDWYEFDVTALVAGNATYTFNLESVSSDAIKFSSREVAGFEPQLVVTSG